MTDTTPSQRHTTLYRRIWRWHFFAGLFVVPFAIVLAVTGSIYLFANEIEGFIDHRIFASATPLEAGSALPADQLVAHALANTPDSQLVRYILPDEGEPAARIMIRAGGEQTLVWVDRTTGTILHQTANNDRFLSIVQHIHSSLLSGWVGNRLVELAASLMIILIVTGVWLHWPRGRSLARQLVPDFSASGRAFWKSLHGSVGLIGGGLILGLLLTGLPWTGVWGDGFTKLRQAAGWTGPGQEWFVTLQSSSPPGVAPLEGDGLKLWSTNNEEGEVTVTSGPQKGALKGISLQWVTEAVAPEHFPGPIWVQPPRGENGVWTVRAMPSTRHLRETVHFDQWTGAEIMRIRFSDYHPVEKAMGHGLSFHEGALFGPLNQAVGVFTAFCIILLSVAGTLSWLKRRPQGEIGIPVLPERGTRLPIGVITGIVALLIFLPVAGIAIGALLILDKLISMISAQQKAQQVEHDQTAG